jgi:hypothetical protein
MAQARGFKAQLVAGFESGYGQTPASPTGFKLPVNSAQVKSKQNLVDSATVSGRRDPAEPVRGNIDVSGTVVAPVDEVGIGYWLKAMFGAPVTTGSADPYSHVFKAGDSQPSLVLEQGFPDIGVYELFNGCKVNKFALNLGGDAELVANIDILGAKETVATASFVASPTAINLARFNNYQASIQEGGASIATVTNATLNVEFGLLPEGYTLGGGYRTSLPEGQMKISGEIKAFFENKALLDKALAGTESSLSLKLTNGAHSLEFLLPEIVYERNAPGIEGSKGILVELPYRAFYGNNAQGGALVVTLKNGQTTYA